jgi:hypothetical protein
MHKSGFWRLAMSCAELVPNFWQIMQSSSEWVWSRRGKRNDIWLLMYHLEDRNCTVCWNVVTASIYDPVKPSMIKLYIRHRVQRSKDKNLILKLDDFSCLKLQHLNILPHRHILLFLSWRDCWKSLCESPRSTVITLLWMHSCNSNWNSFKEIFSFINVKTKLRRPNQATTQDVPTVIFVFSPKNSFTRTVVSEKKYYLHDINSILCLFFYGYLINF